MAGIPLIEMFLPIFIGMGPIMVLLHFTLGALTIAGGLILLILSLAIVLSPGEKKEVSSVAH